MSDQALAGSMPGGDPGDLNDTVGNTTGDGDLMSNSFVADFFATHQGLDQDTYGQSVLQATNMDAPQLENYIAQQQGLTSAAGTTMDSSSGTQSATQQAPINQQQWAASATTLDQALGLCGCHCYLAAGQSVEF
jgi:hypothetical protein